MSSSAPSQEEIRQIVDLLLARVREQLRVQRIDLEITQERRTTYQAGLRPDYGARPLRRVIQHMVEDPLAEALLLGRFQAGQTVRVDQSQDAGLTIEPVTEKTPVEAGLGAAGSARSRYVCGTCGAASLRWEGQCRSCGGWNPLSRPSSSGRGRPRGAKRSLPRRPRWR